jgi:glucose-1-phosphate adenylyltransferase
VFPPTITAENNDWYRGTADALYQNLDFLKRSHEPYVVIAAGDGVYKLDYNKVLEYHIEKKADITIVCKDMPAGVDVTRFGMVKTNADGRITDFEEKPMVADSTTISCGIYVIRRRQLIELLERCAGEGQYDFVKDILVRYKNLKRIYAYKLDSYWNNIASVESYYETNMDFLKPDIRNHFLVDYPHIYSKVHDLPPAKYNPGSEVRNALIGSGSIINGTVENSLLFKKVFIGSNCVVKNSIIMDDVYLGDNTYVENCVVESGTTIRANTAYKGEGEIKVVVENSERYHI